MKKTSTYTHTYIHTQHNTHITYLSETRETKNYLIIIQEASN
jgi:hypothetical protein